MPLAVRGLRELNAAFAKADRDVRLGLRHELRDIARPVAQDAQALAMSEIAGMHKSPQWAGMRIGVTRKLVYVAPKQKGTRSRGPARYRRGQGFAHPPFSDILMGRAMEPALERSQERVVRDFERLLDEMADKFNRGG